MEIYMPYSSAEKLYSVSRRVTGKVMDTVTGETIKATNITITNEKGEKVCGQE